PVLRALRSLLALLAILALLALRSSVVGIPAATIHDVLRHLCTLILRQSQPRIIDHGEDLLSPCIAVRNRIEVLIRIPCEEVVVHRPYGLVDVFNTGYPI